MCLGTLSGHEDWVYSLAALPNGLLASGSLDSTIRLWDTKHLTCLTTLRGHECWVSALVTLQNGLLASGSLDKTIKLWDASYALIASASPSAASRRTPIVKPTPTDRLALAASSATPATFFSLTTPDPGPVAASSTSTKKERMA